MDAINKADDFTYTPNAKDPTPGSGAAGHYWKRPHLRIKWEGCGCDTTKKRLVWSDGSPHIDVGFAGKPEADWHEQAHVVNAITAFRETVTGYEAVLNVCVNKQGVTSVGEVIENRWRYFNKYLAYLDEALHAGLHPIYGTQFQYGDTSLTGTKKQVEALDKDRKALNAKYTNELMPRFKKALE